MEVITAPDGAQAVKLFSKYQQKIGLAILDMTMPEIDGLDTAQAIREENPDLPIILYSGYSIEEMSARALGKNISLFLTKPFTFDEFVRAVKSALKLAKKSLDSDTSVSI